MEVIIVDKTKKGTIKFYDNQKGFGYINSDGTDIYFDSTGLIDKIKNNDNVIFTLKKGKNNIINATEVKIWK